MQARSTSPSSASLRQASPSRWSIDWALAADSIRPRSTWAWRSGGSPTGGSTPRPGRRPARRRPAQQVRRRRRGGSTVRTPTTSPSRIRGWPWAERMPSSLDLLVGGPPSGVVGLDRLPVTDDAREEGGLVQAHGRRAAGRARTPAVRWARRPSGTGRPSRSSPRRPRPRRGWRPAAARRRGSISSTAAWASYGDDVTAAGPPRAASGDPSTTRSRSAGARRSLSGADPPDPSGGARRSPADPSRRAPGSG